MATESDGMPVSARRAAEQYRQRFGEGCTAVSRAPGRVNLLGEHVDYNDGLVMPVAIDRATYLAFGPAAGEHCTVSALDLKQEFSFETTAVKAAYARSKGVPGWAMYPMGVAWSLQRDGLKTPSLNAVVTSEVPRGAGLSSSASIELAFATAWRHLGGWDRAPMDLALACQRAENEYVGVHCGIMDQAASACSVGNSILLLDCRSLEYRFLPLPDSVAIVVADTGVRHHLAGSAYNARRAACEQAVSCLKASLPGIRSLRDVSLAQFLAVAQHLGAEPRMRARHVITEIERTNQAIPLLEAGDIRGFGRLMNDCHASLRDLYEVSCPELDALAEIAWAQPACFGARLTGAGFGGCTVNLVERSFASEFCAILGEQYRARTGRTAQVYSCSASSGASVLH